MELFTLFLVSTCDGVLSFSNIVTELRSHWPGENTMGGTVHNRAIEHHIEDSIMYFINFGNPSSFIAKYYNAMTRPEL